MGLFKPKAPTGAGWEVGVRWRGMFPVFHDARHVASFERYADALAWASARRNETPVADNPPAYDIATLAGAMASKVGMMAESGYFRPSLAAEAGLLDTSATFFVGDKTPEGWPLHQRMPNGILSFVRHYTRRSNAQAAADRLNGHD